MPLPLTPLPPLIPEPTQLIARPGLFTLDAHTTMRCAPGAESAGALLRTLLAPATGLPLALSPTGEVVLVLDSGLGGLGEEGYGLTISPQGLLLRAARPAGLLRGIQTIRQLLPPEALSDMPQPRDHWPLPCVEITDVPRHSWRGAMLDVARHFRPVGFVRRYVDLLAFHKLNVLHLHLTDDQGWRMPVSAYPDLTEIGGHRAETVVGAAGSGTYDGTPHGGSYTRRELTDLVAYAAERGVEVVPEIEMPGHVRAALAAYPELGNHPGVRHEVWTEWGVCDTVLGVHDLALDFCRTVLAEVMDVFPSPYVHVGGDECPTGEWAVSPSALRRVAEEGLAGPAALQGWFMGRVGAFLTAHGRRPMGWAETGSELPPGFVVATWRDQAHGLAAARRGHQVVMAHHRSTYLDYPQSADPAEPPGQPGEPVDLRTVHSYQPVPAAWEPEAAARVIGIQCQLWTEYASTPGHVEYLTFPRLCALADRAWSDGPAGPDWAGFTARMRPHQDRLDALGVRYRPLSVPRLRPVPPQKETAR